MVVVQQSWFPVRDDVPLQPGGDLLVQRLRAVLFRRPAAFDPTGHRARQEPIGAAEVVQTDRRRIDRVDRRDRLQQHLRQSRAKSRAGGERRRNGFPDDKARPVFQDLKPLPADGRIVAEMQTPRNEWQSVRQPGQDAMLARHVVGTGRQFTHRRAAQYSGPAVQINQIIEVREPAGELARRRIGVQAHPLPGQVRAHRRPVQPDTVLWSAKAVLLWHVSSYRLASSPGRSQY